MSGAAVEVDPLPAEQLTTFERCKAAADAFEQFSPLPPLRGPVATIGDEITELSWLEQRARAVCDEAYRQRDTELLRLVQDNLISLAHRRREAEEKLRLARGRPRNASGAMAQTIGQRLSSKPAPANARPQKQGAMLGSASTHEEAERAGIEATRSGNYGNPRGLAGGVIVEEIKPGVHGYWLGVRS